MVEHFVCCGRLIDEMVWAPGRGDMEGAMRIDDIVRTERYFSAGLLLHLLLANDFAGVRHLLKLLHDRGIVPPGVVAEPFDPNAIQVIAELAVWRDLLKHPSPPIFDPDTHVPRDVIDVVVIVGGLLVAIEAKFFSPTRLLDIRHQLASQRQALQQLDKYPAAGIQHVCQIVLTADPTVDASSLRLPMTPDVGVITWMDIAEMAEQLQGKEAYMVQRLRCALDRYAIEFGGGEAGPNWAGIEGLTAVLQRCRTYGASVVVGYAGGEAELRQRPRPELNDRRFKWDWASGGVGKKLPKNWLPGNRFSEIVTSLHQTDSGAVTHRQP